MTWTKSLRLGRMVNCPKPAFSRIDVLTVKPNKSISCRLVEIADVRQLFTVYYNGESQRIDNRRCFPAIAESLAQDELMPRREGHGDEWLKSWKDEVCSRRH